MSCQVPKNLHFTETILTFAPFEATLRRMCAGERTGKKLSHNSASQIHFPPRWAGGRHGLQCAPCSAPKMSKNHSRPLLLTGGDRHFFTDTLCPIPPAVNCCCSPDFLEIRFVLQRNLIFSWSKILFPISQIHLSTFELADSVSAAAVWGLLPVSAFLTGGFGEGREPRRWLEGGRPAHNTRTKGADPSLDGTWQFWPRMARIRRRGCIHIGA